MNNIIIRYVLFTTEFQKKILGKIMEKYLNWLNNSYFVIQDKTKAKLAQLVQLCMYIDEKGIQFTGSLT